MNYGGLHNRLTNQIFLEPFSLRECQEFCEKRKLGYTERQILEAYMALGGIPYYWSFERGQSVAQNFDRMFFLREGNLLRNSMHSMHPYLKDQQPIFPLSQH